jgi:G protein beta subunit-like protein
MNSDILLVSSGYDMYIRLWSNFQDNNCKYQIEWKENAINALVVTPNKDFVVFASGNSVKFLELHALNQKNIISIDSHEGLVSTILIPNNVGYLDNCFISAGEDCTVRINDRRDSKGAIKTFYHSNYVNSVQIANQNKDIISADENGTIKIWDIIKGDVRSEYNSNTNEEGLAFRSISLAENEGYLIGAKSNGTCCVFDYDNSKDIKLLNNFEAHKTYITKCILNSDNNLLATCSADNEIGIWQKKKDSKEFEKKAKLIGHKKWVWDCDFSLDSKFLISCSSDKTIKVWELENGKNIHTFHHSKGVNHIALCDDETN